MHDQLKPSTVSPEPVERWSVAVKLQPTLVRGSSLPGALERLPAGYGAVLEMLATMGMRYDAAGKALEDPSSHTGVDGVVEGLLGDGCSGIPPEVEPTRGPPPRPHLVR